MATPNSSKRPAALPRAAWDWLLSLLRRLFAPALDDDAFLRGLLQAAAGQIAEALQLEEQDVGIAFQRCRAGQANELARQLCLRVDCSLKRSSASAVAVTLSIFTLKEGKPVVTQISRDASWDELPQEVRAEFIRNNPPEMHYVICEASRDPQRT
jgi:hypothetical protein